MIRDRYLEDALRQLRKHKELADRAIAQVSDERLFTGLEGGGNSIAIVMKHMAGNMRSRWTDFLTSDGEKPDRNRDGEFEHAGESADELRRVWDAGWELTIAAIAELGWRDLEATVTIRGEPHDVIAAINRQLAQFAGVLVAALELAVAVAVRLLAVAGQEVGPAGAHVARHVLHDDGDRGVA